MAATKFLIGKDVIYLTAMELSLCDAYIESMDLNKAAEATKMSIVNAMPLFLKSEVQQYIKLRTEGVQITEVNNDYIESELKRIEESERMHEK